MKYFSSGSILFTNNCNLACPYCYEKTKGTDIITEEVIRKAIQFLTEGAIYNKKNKISIDFFGGEPLLALDRLDYALDYTYPYLDSIALTTGKIIKPDFNLVTNGTIWNKDVEHFLLKWRKLAGKISVQFSFDGSPEVQAKSRIAKNNIFDTGKRMEDTLDAVINFCYLNGIKIEEEFCVHSVVTPETITSFCNNYKYFLDKGFPVWHFLLREGDWTQELSLIYEEELKKLRKILSSYPNSLIQACSSFKNKNNCKGPTCGAGIDYCSITPSGDIYPCHNFIEMGEPYKLGSLLPNIQIDKDKKDFYEHLDKQDFIGNKNCNNCEFCSACQVCIATNIAYNVLPSLNFPKVCSFTEAEYKNNLIIAEMLGEKMDDKINIDDFSKFLTEYLDKVTNGIKDNNERISEGLSILQNQMNELKVTQQDILNLLLYILGTNETRN